MRGATTTLKWKGKAKGRWAVICGPHVRLFRRRTHPLLVRAVATSIGRQFWEVIDGVEYGGDPTEVVRVMRRDTGGCPACFIKEKAGFPKWCEVFDRALNEAVRAV